MANASHFSKTFVSFLLLVTSFSSLSEQRTIDLVAGLAKPPYIIEENKSGLQIELIREAFATENFNVKFTHMPLGRNITGFRQWGVDGVITLPEDYEYPGLIVSKPYIKYENVAVSLADKNVKVKTVNDLSGKSVIAFQNARKFLSEQYQATVAYSIDYREIADQHQQVRMLFSGRTEVIILDINIFLYIASNETDPVFRKQFEVHRIFNERPYSAGFKTQELKDIFERGIETIKNNGTYQYLMDKYRE